MAGFFARKIVCGEDEIYLSQLEECLQGKEASCENLIWRGINYGKKGEKTAQVIN